VAFRLSFAPFMGMLLALLCACSRHPKASDAPTSLRIVSLAPSTTEAVYALGAGAQLVGRSRFCDYPAEARGLPIVGGFVDPNLEAILALRPSLVVGARGPAGRQIVDQLEARGVATYFPPTESLSDIEAMLRGLGERTRHVTEAERLTASIRTRLAAIALALEGRPKPRVLLLFGVDPVSAAGPKTFADELLRHAGAKNVITEGAGYPTLGLERVLALDPDLVIDAAVMDEHAAERLHPESPGWSKVRAVREKRVIRLTDDAMFRPGPRIADGLTALARALHPDAAIFDAGPP
jgi:iron complex transport system substrate-binding protein